MKKSAYYNREMFFSKKVDFPEFTLEFLIQLLAKPGILKEHAVMIRSNIEEKNGYASSIDDVIKGFKSGCSLHVRNLERLLPNNHGIVSIFFELQEKYNLIGDSISVFATPPNSKALNIHHDETEIFTYQVQGSKHWSIFQRIVSDKPGTHSKNEVRLRNNITVTSGDFFYLPKGTIHDVSGTNEMSISIAFIYTPILNKSILINLLDEFATYNRLANEGQIFNHNKDELKEMISQFIQFICKIDETDIGYVINKILSKNQIAQIDTETLMNKLR